MDRLRISWFSQFDSQTLSGSGSKSEYFSRQVVPLLKTWFDIDCFAESPTEVDDISVSSYKNFYKKHRQCQYDLCFYQIEDSDVNLIFRNIARIIPGVLYCHDFYQTKGTISLQQNSHAKSRVVWCHPEAEGRFIAKDQSNTNFYPECLNGLIRLFSTERNLNDFLEYAAFDAGLAERNKTFYVPFAVKKISKEKGSVRNVFCFCGGVESEYRALKVFEVLHLIPNIKVCWLVSGFEHSQAVKLVNENQFKFIEVIAGKTPEKWQDLMADAQGAILTVFSAYRDLEPYTSISIGSGVPTIVSDYAHGATLPKGIVYPIPVGYEESPALAQAVKCIINKEQNGDNSISPQHYIEELHSPEVVADQIRIVLSENSEYLKNAFKKWTRYNIIDPFLKDRNQLR